MINDISRVLKINFYCSIVKFYFNGAIISTYFLLPPGKVSINLISDLNDSESFKLSFGSSL